MNIFFNFLRNYCEEFYCLLVLLYDLYVIILFEVFFVLIKNVYVVC